MHLKLAKDNMSVCPTPTERAVPLQHTQAIFMALQTDRLSEFRHDIVICFRNYLSEHRRERSRRAKANVAQTLLRISVYTTSC